MHHKEYNRVSRTFVIHEEVGLIKAGGLFRGESKASEGWSASRRRWNRISCWHRYCKDPIKLANNPK